MGPTSSDAEPTLRGYSAGTRVFGRYTLVSILGRGGMGVVWRARDDVLGEDVALKFLPDAVRWDPGAYEDLKDETRRARQLTHPNIVRIHDFVEDPGTAAISMELVEGATLTALRLEKPNKVLEVADILPWLPQLCAALDYAHGEARVVHRDLKPTNLMLTREGRLKIADFGVARSMADSITRVSMMTAGTLVYMSPQQAMGEEPTPADDVYAVGATLYELLTGKPPFHTGDVRMQLFQRKPDTIPARRKALGVVGAPVPAAWSETIVACLAKEAVARPASVAEIELRLRSRRAARRKVRWRPSRRAMLAAGAALVLGAGVFFGLQLRRPTPAEPVFESDAARAIGAWNLDGDAVDGSGHGWDGNMARALPTRDRFGRIDRALRFNGSSYVVLPDKPELRWSGRDPFTASIWVRQDESPSLSGMVWAGNGMTVGALIWSLGFSDGRMSAAVARIHHEGGAVLESTTRLPMGEWHHVALVSDGTEAFLYVDGAAVAKRPLGKNQLATAPSAIEIRMGHPYRTSRWGLNGALDDARLWRRALSAQEVAALADRTPPPRFALSAGSAFETDDIDGAVRTEFGPEARLADWDEIKRRWSDDARSWADDIGVPVGGAGWVTRNGERRFDQKRYYFASRFDGVQPSYFAVHDEFCGLTFALGSWFATRLPALVSMPAPGIRTETLPVEAETRMIRRDRGVGQNRVAMSLTWRIHLVAADERAVNVRLRLANSPPLHAVCDTKPNIISFALGPEGPGGVTQTVAAGFGDFNFELTARDRQLSFRAASLVGDNPLFQRELHLPEFRLADLIAIEIEGGPNSGLATATLVVE